MTTIRDKIRRRIRTWEKVKGETITEIEITEKEANELGNIDEIDNIKLIVVEKIGDMRKKDCFAYDKGKELCTVLESMRCKSRKCRFYKNNIKKEDIEKSIEKYRKKNS